MSELRFDPFHCRWVIIATERARRPSDFILQTEPRESRFCPFCTGNEDKTPPEILAHRGAGAPPNSGGWEVRVIPNKFPALRPDGELNRHAVGIFDAVEAIGAHEVVIHSPDHFAHFSELTVPHISLILQTWRTRLAALLEDPRYRYVMLFMNYGSQAGASLAHPHSQIIAMPVIPQLITDSMRHARDYYGRKERCLLNDIVLQELNDKVRVVIDHPAYAVIAPFASRFPYELMLVPRRQVHCFEDSTDEDLVALATVLKETLARLKYCLGDPPFNVILQNTPNARHGPRKHGQWATLPYDWRWYIEIIPRLTQMAGFEWGTGFFINPTSPEDTARALREVQLP